MDTQIQVKGCTCRPVNVAPFRGRCGSCGGAVEPGCACEATKLTRCPRHAAVDPALNGRCTAAVEVFGQVCVYCASRCG